jgi:hypothetical protein
VAATRRMYFRTDQSRLTRERTPRPHRFETGTRDNVRAFTLGPEVVGGQVMAPMSSAEVVELLLMSLAGGVTPTGAGVPKLWTFTPGTTLDPVSMEWQDGARAWRAAGCHGGKLKIAGSVEDECTLTMDVFGRAMTTHTMTGSLAERVPEFIEGWETQLFVDAFEGTPGSTAVAGTLINWDIEIDNKLERKYFATNTLAAGGISIGELEVKAKLTYEAAASAAASEFTNWNGATKRLVSLLFGDNEVIDGSDKKFVQVDIPGAWEAFDLGGTDKGTRVYELSLQYVYDPTNAFGLRIRAQNERATAY